MEEKSSIKGFLKGILGFPDTGIKSAKNDLSTGQPAGPPQAFSSNQAPVFTVDPGAHTPSQPLAPAPSSRPIPQTEAYKNRKKGRKQHGDTIDDLKRIIDCLQRRGESTPAELSRDLDMARSTLTYNLKRLSAYKPGVEPTPKNYWKNHLLMSLLGQKRLERLGGGGRLRYRLAEVAPPGSEAPQ
jgi:hypothetical protein